MQSGSMANPNNCCPAYPTPIAPTIVYTAQIGSSGAATSPKVAIVRVSDAATYPLSLPNRAPTRFHSGITRIAGLTTQTNSSEVADSLCSTLWAK